MAIPNPPKTPEECDRLFGEYANAGNIDALVALYEPRATFVPQSGEPVTGHAAIRQQLAAFEGRTMTLAMNVVKAVRASDDLAVLYNDWTGTMKGPDGATVKMAGKAIEIVRRQPDGTWRFVVDDPFARG